MPSITVLSEYPGINFAGSSGGAPPDTQGAAGPNSYVETVNLAVSIYSPKSTGSTAVTDSTSDFFFTRGGLPHANASDAQSDTFTIFDPQVQRFIVGELDFQVDTNGNPVNDGGNALLLGVSKSADPATLTSADWYFYEVNTAETGVAIQDYPGNVGYNADALVITLNSFSTTADLHTQVNSISMTSLINGTPLTGGTNLFQTDLATEFLPRPAVMPDSTPGGPMWMVAAANKGGQSSGTANTVDVVKMTNVLSTAPTFTTTTLAVNPYSLAVSPLQPNGQAITSAGFTDSRIMKTAERNGVLVATQIVSNAAGDLDNARWYAINVSGTPSLQQQGDVSGGSGVYDTYPGIDINAQGDIGMSFMQSGTAPGQFLSVYVTGRTPADAPGTMETPVLVQAGAGNYVEGSGFGNPPEYRLGDMSGINVDSNGSFWIANEYADNEPPGANSANWGTAIANFTLAPPIAIVLANATEGQPLVNVPVATLVDNSGAPLSDYSATISWGDGSTSAGQVVANGTGNFVILGSHTYAEEGNYTLTVSVSNGKTTFGPVKGVITVADAPLIAGPPQPLNSKVGAFLSDTLLATFTDTDQTNTPADPQNNPADYTATISFFEPGGIFFNTTGHIAALGNNTYAVYGSSPFSFASAGAFSVKVVIRDAGGATVEVDDVVNVANNPAIPPLVPQYQADGDPSNALFLTLQNALSNLISAERLFISSLFGPVQHQEAVIPNLMNAYVQYEFAVTRFDLLLPNGPSF